MTQAPTPEARLGNYIQLVNDPFVGHLLSQFLEDWRFNLWPASIDKHHAYPGGLLTHTTEVVERCLETVDEEVDLDVLVTAATLHDVAKLGDYDLVHWERVKNGSKVLACNESTCWVRSPYYSTIHHVVGSYGTWRAHLGREYESILGTDFERAVSHCLLAHHGRKDWGSPVEPQSREALILHQADAWSCHYGPTAKRSS